MNSGKSRVLICSGARGGGYRQKWDTKDLQKGRTGNEEIIILLGSSGIGFHFDGAGQLRPCTKNGHYE